MAMMNKRGLLSGILFFMGAGLMLIACNETTKESVGAGQRMSEQLTDYSNPGISAFAAKLRNSDAERVHIVVIGDSHTAADIFTGKLRQQFQDKYGNGGIGFISPLAVRGNRYSNVSFGNTKGWRLETSRGQSGPNFTLGGYIATPLRGSSQIQITALDGAPSMKAQVLYRTFGGSTLQIEGTPLPLVDSQGQWALSEATRVPTTFAFTLPDVNETQLAGIWLTSPQAKGVIVSALGSNGAQLSMLDRWQDDWPATLSLLNPDMVILAYGTNEAFNIRFSLHEYRQTLVRQVAKIRQINPEIAILLVGPGSSIMYTDATRCEQRQPPLLKPIIAVQKQVAESEQILFWDWFARMGGDCAMDKLAGQGLARPDLIHLTSEGYQQSAMALWYDLQNKLNQ